MIVADANLWVALLLKHEKSAVADAVFGLEQRWHAPWLCLSELRNAGLMYVKRELTTAAHLVRVVEHWRLLVPAKRRHHPDDSLVVQRAWESGCTAYDCEYVVTAEVLGLPLLTWDKQVLKAFPDIAQPPEAYVASRAEISLGP